MTDDHAEHTDAIRAGMEKWEQTRKAAQQAIERCKAAEERAAWLTGQNELLARQNLDLTSERDQLRVMVEEAKVHMAAFATMVLNGLENLKLGNYRQPGSVKVTSDSADQAGLQAVSKALGPAVPQFLTRGNGNEPA